MSGDGISRIRKSWFKSTPPGKKGVTERYVVFGEARRWMVNHLGLGKERVLDVGSGHGFLTYEIASLTRSHVFGLDFLSGDQMRTAFGGVKLGGFLDRISFIVGDARSMPFPAHKFDAVVSFNALGDVYMTSGQEALGHVIRESCRVLRTGGLFAFADNLFPECLRDASQKLYGKIHREEFKAYLPSVEAMRSNLGTLKSLTQVQLDPHISLSMKEARIELKDVVDARPFGKVFDYGSLWKKYMSKIRAVGLSYPDELLISGFKR